MQDNLNALLQVCFDLIRKDNYNIALICDTDMWSFTYCNYIHILIQIVSLTNNSHPNYKNINISLIKPFMLSMSIPIACSHNHTEKCS